MHKTMKSPANKQINTREIREKQDNAEHDFSFPHYPHPVSVKAKNITEATEKFNKIISNKEEE